MAPVNRSYMTYWWSVVVTSAVSFTIFEIKQDIGQRMPIFHTPFQMLVELWMRVCLVSAWIDKRSGSCPNYIFGTGYIPTWCDTVL